MRNLGNFLSDPGLHLLAIAFLLACLAIGGGAARRPETERPLEFCKACRTYLLPGMACGCTLRGKMADARP